MCPGQKIIIDRGHVASIDAVAVIAIMGMVRRAPAVGATVELRNARPPVRRRIDLVTGGDSNRITTGLTADAAFSGRLVTALGRRRDVQLRGINNKLALFGRGS
jgi:hypothetical protein